MQVFVTGATGVLGHRLVERLADRGHTVHGLVRNDAGAELVHRRGGIPHHGDVLNPGSLVSLELGDDIDVLVHAATAIPTSTKPSEEEWEENDRVRFDGIRNLLTAFGDDLEHVMFPSVVWVARRSDGSRFDESADLNPDRSTRSAAAVERYLTEKRDEYGFEQTVLRCGFFYGPDSAHTRQWGRRLLSRELPVVGDGLLGRGDVTFSFLHVDDAARGFATALDHELTGLYHLVDDASTTTAAFFRQFADLLDVPEPRRLPWWLVRPVLGEVTTNLLRTSMPTTNRRFEQATGWQPKYPTHEDGLKQVVETWRNDGTLEETEEGHVWSGND